MVKKKELNVNIENIILIPINIIQLFKIGLFMGHSRRYSIFLGTWCVKGWRKTNIIPKVTNTLTRKYAIMDLVPSILQLRICLDLIFISVLNFRNIWFISHSQIFGPYVARYAMLCGEVFSAYSWIPGTLTNFSGVFLYYFYCLFFWSKGYVLQHKQRKRLVLMTGLNFTRGLLPGFIFLPRVIESLLAMKETAQIAIPTISIVDSNIISGSINMPIPGNDDSLICINFFSFLITRNNLMYKIKRLLLWKYKIRKHNRRHSILVLAFICFFFDSYINYKDFNYLPFFSWALNKGNMPLTFNYDEYNRVSSFKYLRGHFNIFEKKWQNLNLLNINIDSNGFIKEKMFKNNEN